MVKLQAAKAALFFCYDVNILLDIFGSAAHLGHIVSHIYRGCARLSLDFMVKMGYL